MFLMKAVFFIRKVNINYNENCKSQLFFNILYINVFKENMKLFFFSALSNWSNEWTVVKAVMCASPHVCDGQHSVVTDSPVKTASEDRQAPLAMWLLC